MLVTLYVLFAASKLYLNAMSVKPMAFHNFLFLYSSGLRLVASGTGQTFNFVA
jgi:hypothetical protein